MKINPLPVCEKGLQEDLQFVQCELLPTTQVEGAVLAAVDLVDGERRVRDGLEARGQVATRHQQVLVDVEHVHQPCV